MSMWLTNEILEMFDMSTMSQNITSTEKFILLAIAKFSNNKTNLSHPSILRICRITGFSKRCVISNIDSLNNKGFLTVKAKFTKSGDRDNNEYFIDLEMIRGSERSSPRGEPDALGVVNDVHHGSERSTPQVVNEVHLNYKSTNKLTNKKLISPSGDVAPSVTHSRFEDFWKAYPIKQNKKKAKQIWQRKKLDEKADFIIADVNQRKERHQQWKNGFIPHATTFLNGERWEDDITESANGNSGLGVKSNGQQFDKPKSKSEQQWDFLFKAAGLKDGENIFDHEVSVPAEVSKLLSD